MLTINSNENGPKRIFEGLVMASEVELSMYGFGLAGSPVTLVECLLNRCSPLLSDKRIGTVDSDI